MVSGKEVRISQITRDSRMLCIPMDHGVSDGPIKGLDTITDTIDQVVRGGCTAILIHKGVIRSLQHPTRTGIIMHLSANTTLSPNPNRKVMTSSVETAIRLGASAVSAHINVGNKDDSDMLADLGALADECFKWSFPLIAMMYPRGENIKNPTDPWVLAHVARAGSELGADIVKTPYSGDPDSFKDVVRGCRVPLVIAGGPKTETDRGVLEMAQGALEAGAIGVTFGRNVFQHSNPEAMVRALATIVFEKASVNEALAVLKDASKR